MSDLATTTTKKVHIDVIIPTLGVRETLFDVISTLEKFAGDRPDAQVRVFISFNTKPAFGRKIYLKDSYDRLPNFSVREIAPESYQPTSEHHLLWCLKWYKANVGEQDAIVWPVTDFDPLIQAGFDAVVDFLHSHKPDLFYINNLWAGAQGELMPSPAFRTNQLIWHGDASYFFRALGFEHATSNIGGFCLRSGFITDEIISMFEATLARAEQCAHAWWMMEAGMSTKAFYFVATPIVMNKFNVHHFDESPTWKENANRGGVPSQYDWTIGFMKHLQYYVESGKMTYKELRTAMLSEPQRGILPFLDDILRRLFVQAKFALRRPSERFGTVEIALIKRVWGNIYPLRMPMINHLCDVLDKSNGDQVNRLKAYKLAIRFKAIEEDQGIFSILFRNAAYGYYYYEHNSGFVAVLEKALVYKAYRDLDPVDLNPYILYASTEEQLLEKIKQARQLARAEALLHNFDYFTVHLHSAPNPMTRLPHLQLWLLSQREAVIRLVKRVMFPVAVGRRNVSRVLSLLR
jgi:hypothetical protein